MDRVTFAAHRPQGRLWEGHPVAAGMDLFLLWVRSHLRWLFEASEHFDGA